MPAILAIETSTAACSVALRHISDTGEVRDWWLQSDQPRTHSATLLQLIEQLLEQAQLARTQLSAVAISTGPGSFTGLRIGLAVAQGLAVGLALPLLPIDSLEVLASTAQQQRSLPAGETLVAVTDARMQQFNFGHFTLAHAQQRPIHNAPLQLCGGDQVVQQSCAAQTLAGEISSLQCGDLDSVNCLEILPRADAMLAAAQQLFTAGGWPTASKVELIYLRGSEAWQKHQPIMSPSSSSQT